MKLFFVVMNVACAVVFLFLGIILIIRKGKPIIEKKTTYENDEERLKSEKSAFIMGIILFIQSIAMLILAAGIYFEILFLLIIAFGLMVPMLVWSIKTLAKKKPKKPTE